tara:strand:+ start:117 stop:539 length:423 start_codon:yes stop_codon:yes gene_type:complete
MIFAALLLAGATVPGPDVSPLAEADHVHEWTQAYADAEGTLWIDPTWRASWDVDGVELPLYLMRMEMRPDGLSTVVADMAMVVDCEGSRMGLAGAWTEAPEAGAPGAAWVDEVEMDFTQEPFGDDDVTIFRAVCGPDWQP